MKIKNNKTRFQPGDLVFLINRYPLIIKRIISYGCYSLENGDLWEYRMVSGPEKHYPSFLIGYLHQVLPEENYSFIDGI